jgi:hypothetical protein
MGNAPWLFDAAKNVTFQQRSPSKFAKRQKVHGPPLLAAKMIAAIRGNLKEDEGT